MACDSVFVFCMRGIVSSANASESPTAVSFCHGSTNMASAS